LALAELEEVDGAAVAEDVEAENGVMSGVFSLAWGFR
jgi:hypothetical protein